MRQATRASQASRRWLFVVAGLLGATPAFSHPRCLAPTGGDDTAPLQAALERCVGATRACSVDLCAGIFHTGILRARGFRGTLRGAGASLTVLRAWPDLAVNDNPSGYWLDDPFDPARDPWPWLVQLLDARATLRDLAVEVPTPPAGLQPTKGWFGGTLFELAGAILVSGRGPVDVTLDRVRVSAGPNPATGLGAAITGVSLQGLLLNPDDTGSYPVYPVTGRFSVTNSEIRGVVAGASVIEAAAADVTVAGSRFSAPVVFEAIDTDASRITLVGNTWDTAYRAAQLYLNLDGNPARANDVLISRNRGRIAAGGDGVYFLDPFDRSQPPGATRLRVRSNTLDLGEAGGPAASGITAIGPVALLVDANLLRGRAGAGIDVDETTGCRVRANGLRDLATAGGPHVRLGPQTSDCHATVSVDDTVVDLGAANRVTRR